MSQGLIAGFRTFYRVAMSLGTRRYSRNAPEGAEDAQQPGGSFWTRVGLRASDTFLGRRDGIRGV